MLAVILNQHLIKRRKQEEYKTAHSSPPDYETKNIISSSDGVSCAENDEIQNMVGNIRTILNAKTGKSSEWVEIMCDHFDQEEQTWCVNAWKRGYDNPEDSTVIAKISVSGETAYLNEKAKTDTYAQEVINERIRLLKK